MTHSHPEVKMMRKAKTKTSIGSSKSTSTIPRTGSIQKERVRKGASSARSIPGAKALEGISGRALLSGIRKLSRSERETVLSILVHLIEIDRRGLYAALGLSSLYELCREHLGYSESTAVRRVKIARCIARFPETYRALASGKVSFSNLSQITKIMTSENASGLLCRIEGASKREVELLVSSRRPRSAICDRVTPVYGRTVLGVACDDSCGKGGQGSQGGKKTTATGGGKNPSTSEGSGPASAAESGSKAAALDLRVVLEERLKISFGADPEFIGKVERIRALLSSKYHRTLELGELFSILMDEYIERRSPEGRIRRKEKREKKKAGLEKESGAGKSLKSSEGPKSDKKEGSRYIPQRVRDEVHARDKGCCSYVSPGGRRCGSKWDLQIDHIVPFARGGDNSPGNLRLLCAKHNRLEAERVYGKKHMEQYVSRNLGEHVKESGERYNTSRIERSDRNFWNSRFRLLRDCGYSLA